MRPKQGILDPQGQAVERALPALGFEGVSNVHIGRLVELEVDDPTQVPEMCERLLANPLIEDYEIDASCAGRVKFGVVRFPGSCDEVDALHGGRARSARRAALARATATCGVDAVVVPGGFSYGDYLRAGAIARFSPVMESVVEFAARRRPRARDLQRLPGPVRGGPAAGRAAAERAAALRLPPGRPGRGARRHALHARVRGRASCCRSRSSTRPAATTRRRELDELEATARSCCATRRGRTPTARWATSPASRNEAGNVLGLMPHPEHAVDPLTGSTDGRPLFESLALVAA